jgi:hypothetical protein
LYGQSKKIKKLYNHIVESVKVVFEIKSRPMKFGSDTILNNSKKYKNKKEES